MLDKKVPAYVDMKKQLTNKRMITSSSLKPKGNAASCLQSQQDSLTTNMTFSDFNPLETLTKKLNQPVSVKLDKITGRSEKFHSFLNTTDEKTNILRENKRIEQLLIMEDEAQAEGRLGPVS